MQEAGEAGVRDAAGLGLLEEAVGDGVAEDAGEVLLIGEVECTCEGGDGGAGVGDVVGDVVARDGVDAGDIEGLVGGLVSRL